MTDTAATPAPETADPTPAFRGRFSLYETVQGGYHLTYRIEGEDEDQHVPVPAMLVRMARRGGTSPLAALRALSGGM